MRLAPNLRPLLVAAAICSFLGALTTPLLIFVPGPRAADLPENEN